MTQIKNNDTDHSFLNKFNYYMLMNIDTVRFMDLLNKPVFILVVSLLLVFFVLWINRNNLMICWRGWKTGRLLNSIGIKQIINLSCSDGLDGEFILERLAMLPDEILLIVYKRYSGNIYCAEKISEWTQVLAQKSYKFNNPLFELDHQLTALSELIPGIPVRGVIFFDQNASFPKGYTDRIIHPGSIPAEIMRQNCSGAKQSIEDAWDTLNRLSRDEIPQQQLRVKT